MIPYDPTRQHYTNDLGRADIEADKRYRAAREAYRNEAARTNGYMTQADQQRAIERFEQERDRREMAEAEVEKARDLMHAYGDARVKAHVDWIAEHEHAATAADAFAKLILLVERLAHD